jgi:nitroreductase
MAAAHSAASKSNDESRGPLNDMPCVEAQGGGNFKACRRERAQPEPPLFLKACFSQNRSPGAPRPMTSPVLDFLLTRNSVSISELHEPAPSDAEIATVIKAASRVPDHGRLEPWRFILYRGDARVEVGKKLAALAERREGPLTENRRNQELTRFSRAPLVIGVVSSPKDNPKIPQWEMFLSGGLAAMNLAHAANALGYRTNMITNWYSDVQEGRAILGFAPHERVIGFVHIGTFGGTVTERPRPDVSKLYADYAGPWSE